MRTAEAAEPAPAAPPNTLQHESHPQTQGQQQTSPGMHPITMTACLLPIRMQSLCQLGQACRESPPASTHRSATSRRSSCDTAPEPCCCERAAMSWTRLRATSALGRPPGWRSCCRASCSALQSPATDCAAACHLCAHASREITTQKALYAQQEVVSPIKVPSY